jgi:hypothetical protein
MIDTKALKKYAKSLEKLNDGELIDAFHQAKVGHQTAADANKDQALHMFYHAERTMAGRFGLGEDMKRYLAKYPESPNKER